MKGEYNQLAFIEKVIKKTGPRIAGSKEERLGAELIAKEFKKISGKKAITEKFDCHPYASIALIPIVGYVLLACIALYFFSPLIALIILFISFLFLEVQAFSYCDTFNFLFPKRKSQNVYVISEPKKVDFTLIISGHIDSAWFYKLFIKHPKLATAKMFLGFMSAFLFFLICLLKVLCSFSVIHKMNPVPFWLPLLFIPGFFFISEFISLDKKKASPGAGDNLSAMSIVLWLMNYFRKNPEKRPKNCRAIFMGFGCEEIGVKGSKAFIKRHKKDLLKESVWVLNLENIRDVRYFQVINGDIELWTKYDKKMCELAGESIQESGLKCKVIKCPAGGVDSAYFSKAKIRTVTVNAQKPQQDQFYHTPLDAPENLDKKALIKGNEVCLRLINKLDRFVHKNK